MSIVIHIGEDIRADSTDTVLDFIEGRRHWWPCRVDVVRNFCYTRIWSHQQREHEL